MKSFDMLFKTQPEIFENSITEVKETAVICIRI